MNNQNEQLSKDNLNKMMEIMNFKKVKGTEDLTGPEIYSKFEFLLNNSMIKAGLERLKLNQNAVLASNSSSSDNAFILDGKGLITLPGMLPLFNEKIIRDNLVTPEGSPGRLQPR